MSQETETLIKNTAQAKGMSAGRLLRESFFAFWFDWVLEANRALIEGRDMKEAWDAFRLRHPDLVMSLRRQ